MPLRIPDNLKKVLVFAGYDPSGGAGILMDAKIINSLGAYPVCIPTCLTIQDTKAVYKTYKISKNVIKETMEKIVEDIKIDAVKIGVIYSKEIAKLIYEFIKAYNLKNIVLDPVIASSSGFLFLDFYKSKTFKKLLALCDFITPNISEAELLTGRKIKNLEDMKLSARIIQEMEVKGVIIKGGHLKGKTIDLLYINNQFKIIRGGRINKDVHGTGCIFSSAFTTFLTKEEDPIKAFKKAKNYTKLAIKKAIKVGKGRNVFVL